MQIPCTQCFTGDKTWLDKLVKLFNSKKQPDVADSSSSAKLELVEAESDPVSKKAKLEVIQQMIRPAAAAN